MPRDKDLKRIIRKRMEKTGEAYTSARAHTLDDTAATSDASEPERAETPAVVEPPPSYASIAGMRDDKLKAKTGRDWAEWVQLLDAVDAIQLEHRDIARIVHEEHSVDGWWSQTVTVGYERIRGLRARGQRRGGDWEASRSRTFAVPVDALFDAWAADDVRRRWLTGAEPVVRTSKKPRSLRLDWNDGTIVALWFTSRGPAKSTVSVQHTKVPDAATAERLKAYWTVQLDALATLLRSDATP
ncbi:hypothetical protein BH23GEM9_BH23GEM9_07920 [soil metagenome]